MNDAELNTMTLSSENLAYWYFRLNGFFTIPNFVVHPDFGEGQQTEADVLGVRFPFRRELMQNPMEDDELFTRIDKKPLFVIAEVKRDRIKFNQTWCNPNFRNVQRFLRAAGAVPPDRVDPVSDRIYQTGAFADDTCHIALVGIGRREAPNLARKLPDALQITWKHIAVFISKRFDKYYSQKRRHDQWDDAGQALWDLWEDGAGDTEAFGAAIHEIIKSEDS